MIKKNKSKQNITAQNILEWLKSLNTLKIHKNYQNHKPCFLIASLLIYYV